MNNLHEKMLEKLKLPAKPTDRQMNVIWPNKKIPAFGVIRPYLNLLVKLRIF